jgi:hypothetical protein
MLLFALTAGIGCGGTSSSVGFVDGGAEDATTKDAVPGDMGSFPDIFLRDSSHDGGSWLGCSADLQNVVNAKGAIVLKCPHNEGCTGGACVPACQAAAANRGTLGCDFLLATPSYYPPDLPPDFAVFLANNWDEPLTIQVSRAGVSYDPTLFGFIPVLGVPPPSWPKIPATGLPPGEVGILCLSLGGGPGAQGCPVGPPVDDYGGSAVYSGTSSATGFGEAFHVVTSLPVTAYDALPSGGGGIGTEIVGLASEGLLLPTTAWATNYFGIVPPRGNASASEGPQWGQIVAMQDGTTVNVVPNVTLPSGTGVALAPASAATAFSLDAGEFIQWQDSMEMSSTVFSSNHPIGFLGGNAYGSYASLTSTGGPPAGGGYNSMHQQIPPIGALGHDYVAPPFATRMASLEPESIPYRLVGVVDGTKLTYDPPGIAGAPATLSAGQFADFESTLAFRVTSQAASHPFYVGQLMPGCFVTSGSRPGCNPAISGPCCLGNSNFVNVLPPEQFLEKYIFYADLSYATTNLVFTRVKTPSGFEDVTLDCAGVLTGWQPVGTGGLYEVTNIDLVRATVPNGKCNNGARMATSAGQFGIMVWGLDTFTSYAYPAGGNAQPINSVVVPATPK